MKLAVVTNILTPYRIPLFESLGKSTKACTVLLQARQEENRQWRLRPFSFHAEILPGLHLKPPGAEVSVHLNYGVLRRLRRLDPDVVLSGGFAPAHVAAFLYCKLSGKRYVQWGEFTLRDGAQSSRIKRGLRRLLISGADGCVASSKDAHDAFAQYGADPASILTASMPFEAEELHERVGVCRLAHRESPAREQPSGPALLSVGQLIPRKGWDELFAIYREVVKARPDTVLLIAGDGPCRVAYERLVREAGWSRVRFLGHLDEARLAEQFALADLFLFPTRYDAYGLVLAEAMAAELPVVSSVHAAATRDLVEEGVTGYAIDPRDAEASAGTIVGLLALSGERRRAIGRAAYERVRSCDTKPTADRMVRFLRTIVYGARRDGRRLAPPVR